MRLILLLIGIMLFSTSSLFTQFRYHNVVPNKTNVKSFYNLTINNPMVVSSDSISSPKHSFINLSGQVIVGSIIASGFASLPLLAGYANILSEGSTDATRTTFGILAISSYIFGAAVGVHWIASSENPNLSFWSTVGYSAIGGGTGALLVLFLSSTYNTMPIGGLIIVGLCPIIASMVYASFISEWPINNKDISLITKNISHKDLVDQTKIINIELLRVKL